MSISPKVKPFWPKTKMSNCPRPKRQIDDIDDQWHKLQHQIVPNEQYVVWTIYSSYQANKFSQHFTKQKWPLGNTHAVNVFYNSTSTLFFPFKQFFFKDWKIVSSFYCELISLFAYYYYTQRCHWSGDMTFRSWDEMGTTRMNWLRLYGDMVLGQSDWNPRDLAKCVHTEYFKVVDTDGRLWRLSCLMLTLKGVK